MSDYARKMIEREIERALNPVGSSVHSGKVTLDISHVQYVLAERDALLAAAEKGTEYVLAHINQDLKAERDALLEALKEYGWHHQGCPQYPTYTHPDRWPACTCGFDDAIDAARSKT